MTQASQKNDAGVSQMGPAPPKMGRLHPSDDCPAVSRFAHRASIAGGVQEALRDGAHFSTDWVDERDLAPFRAVTPWITVLISLERARAVHNAQDQQGVPLKNFL